MIFKNLYKNLIKNPFGNRYSKQGTVEVRYILDEQVINNKLESSYSNQTLTDADRDNINEVIDILNESNLGYESRNTNHGKPIVDNGIIYTPITIDNGNQTDILNGNQGVYDGNELYSYGFESNPSTVGLYLSRIVLIQKQGFFLQSNYVTNVVIGVHLKNIENLYKTMTKSAIDEVNSFVLDYVKNVENILNNYIQNIDTLEFKVNDGVSVFDLTPNVTGINIQTQRNRFLTFLNRISIEVQRFKAYFETFVQVVQPPIAITTNRTANTTNIYRDNNLTVSYKDNVFTYDVKTNPSPDGSVNIKIPKEGSYVFITPTSNNQYFLAGASEYDEVDITIDNNLSMRIKDFLCNINSDYWFNYTGLNENQGFEVRFNIFRTSLIEQINLNNKILLTENSFEINGDDSKIGIGIVGEGDISTPYDSDILRLSEQKRNLDDIASLFVDIMNGVTSFGYTTLTDSQIIIKKETLVVANVNNKLNDYQLDKVESYTDYQTLRGDVYTLIENIKKEVTNLSWKYRAAGTSWNSVTDASRFNSYKDRLDNLTNQNISDLLSQNTLASVTPLRINRNRTSNDYNRGEPVSTIFSFLNQVQTIDLNYYNILLSLITSYYTKYQQERPLLNGYENLNCSPEEASTVIVNYIITDLLIISTSLDNLKRLKDEYINDNSGKNIYSESLGDILNDLTNYIKGNIDSYIINPSGTPPFAINPAGKASFDDSIDDINKRVDNLLIK